MRLKESVEDGMPTLALEGEIDLHYAPVLRSLFQAKIAARAPALLLDLSKVDYIDSTGLATMLEYYRDAARHAGILCLVGLSQNLHTVFEIVKMDKAIPMFPTLKEATTAINHGLVKSPPSSLFDSPGV